MGHRKCGDQRDDIPLAQVGVTSFELGATVRYVGPSTGLEKFMVQPSGWRARLRADPRHPAYDAPVDEQDSSADVMNGGSN